MSPIKRISSLQNSLVKKILMLQEKSKIRRNSGLFVMEGLREVGMAIKGNYNLETVCYCPELLNADSWTRIRNLLGSEPSFVEVSAAVYSKLAYRDSTEGILAIGHSKTHALETLSIKTKWPLILVAEAPEKPGNIGALLRTAEAAGLDAVLIANPKGDLYNPNIIRSSVGCLFTTQLGIGSTAEVITYLKKIECAIYCAELNASLGYTEVDYTRATAIVIGTEATGLSSEWLANSTSNIIIPMAGEIDSMNLSVSAAILIFEAKRQRGFIAK